MSCDKVYKPVGHANCEGLRSPIRAFILTDKGTTMTAANAATLGTTAGGWKSILCPILSTSAIEKGVLIDAYRGFEVTTPETEKGTSNLGLTEKVGNEKPSATAYGMMNYLEYASYFAADGKAFDIPLVAENGNILLTQKSDGTLKGFRGRVMVQKGGIPKVGADLQKECPFWLYFDDPSEWEAIIEVDPDFTYTDLRDIVPVGLNVKVTTPYESTGGTLTAKITQRGSIEPFTSLTNVVTQWQIVAAYNDATVAVASVGVTGAATGSYAPVLTAGLVGPVYARVSVETATQRTFVSNVFRIV